MKPNHLQQKILREIVQWIRQERLTIGHKLVTSQLAKQLGVSRSPVLVALDALTESEVIRYDKNKGYTLAKDFDELDQQVEQLPQSGLDELYITISQHHFRESLGDISEAEMMRRFNCSRAILLKCLSRILQEGWVERNEGHGWRFIPVVNNEEAYLESYEFRLNNEPMGLRSPRFEPNPSELQALIDEQKYILEYGFTQLTRQELYDANIRFHETLVSWAHNRFTLQAIQRLNQLRRLVEYQQSETDESRNIQANEHLDILYAIQQGEYPLAAKLLEQHIQRAKKAKLLSS